MAYKTIKSNGIPFKYKDGFGAGNSSTENVVPNNVVNDKETYIGGKGKKEVDMNKIKHTRVGDDIHYYQNGVEQPLQENKKSEIDPSSPPQKIITFR